MTGSQKAPPFAAYEPKWLGISVAAMLPALLIVWLMMAHGERAAWDVEASQWCVQALAPLASLQESLHWPFAHGGWFGVALLGLGLLVRMLGFKKETLLLFACQGMLLLSFSALVTFSKTMAPNLDVLMYMGVGLTALVIARRRFGGSVMTGLALIFAPCILVVMAAYAANGVWVSVLALSVALALAITLTLATSMDGV